MANQSVSKGPARSATERSIHVWKKAARRLYKDGLKVGDSISVFLPRPSWALGPREEEVYVPITEEYAVDVIIQKLQEMGHSPTGVIARLAA